MHAAIQSCYTNIYTILFINELSKIGTIVCTYIIIATKFQIMGIFLFNPDSIIRYLPSKEPQMPACKNEEDNLTQSRIPARLSITGAVRRNADAIHPIGIPPMISGLIKHFLGAPLLLHHLKY